MDINYIFRYLDAEGIVIDKKEFEYQVQTNPEHTSLISIVDALSFFEIETVAFKLQTDKIHTLPEHFVAVLHESNGTQVPYFIKKSGDYFILNKSSKNKVDFEELKNRWTGIVMLARQETKQIIKTELHKPKLVSVVIFLLIITAIMIVVYNEIAWWQAAFLVLPAAGLIFSIFYLKNLFKVNNQFVAKICDESKYTSCKDESDNSSLFSASDLGIIYFPLQIISLLFAFSLRETTEVLSVFKWLSLAVPVIVFISLYTQKFVRKKWCKLCLLINLILILELIVLFMIPAVYETSVTAIFLVFLNFLIITLFWVLLRNSLRNHAELQEKLIENDRIVRNYKLFKNMLLQQRKLKVTPHAFSDTSAKDKKIRITAIISPQCTPCKKAFEMLYELYKKHGELIQLHIVIKTNFELNDTLSKEFYKNLTGIYQTNGFEAFMNSLSVWFENQNLKKWNTHFHNDILQSDAKEKFDLMNDWCILQGLNYTPMLYVNEYQFPSMYETKHIQYFIEELKADNSF